MQQKAHPMCSASEEQQRFHTWSAKKHGQVAVTFHEAIEPSTLSDEILSLANCFTCTCMTSFLLQYLQLCNSSNESTFTQIITECFLCCSSRCCWSQLCILVNTFKWLDLSAPGQRLLPPLYFLHPAGIYWWPKIFVFGCKMAGYGPNSHRNQMHPFLFLFLPHSCYFSDTEDDLTVWGQSAWPWRCKLSTKKKKFRRNKL